MKIAVLADIHAHFVALQTVAAHIEVWQPDAVIVAGDSVNRGPRPLECLQFLQYKAQTEDWQVIIGNHDEYVIHRAGPDRPKSGPVYDFYRATVWTAEQLNNDVSYLKSLPFQATIEGPAGSEVRVVHASMVNTRNGLFPWTTDDEIRQKITPAPQVICVGHTHQPFVRQIDETLVVNVGSAGLPFDGDQRVSYAQLKWQNHQWQAEIIRLDYDYQAAEQDFYNTGYLPDGGPVVELIISELRRADAHLSLWDRRYKEQILAGELTMAESVQDFLAKLS